MCYLVGISQELLLRLEGMDLENLTDEEALELALRVSCQVTALDSKP
jgi:hypothetical protein